MTTEIPLAFVSLGREYLDHETGAQVSYVHLMANGRLAGGGPELRVLVKGMPGLAADIGKQIAADMSAKVALTPARIVVREGRRVVIMPKV